jgi:Zn-dependent protease
LTAPRRSGSDRAGSQNRTAAIVVGVAVLLVYLGVRNGSIHLGQEDAIRFGVLIPSIILHEVSHGWVAFMFGDDTAKRAGRLTLNPIAHVDPFGTVILPAILILTAGSAFGYARPVPVAPSRMRSPRNHSLITSLAGPAVNIMLALLSAVVIRFALLDQLVGSGLGSAPLLPRIVFEVGYVNVILAAFNLIPVPPLDGSAVMERLLPARAWPTYLRLRQYSMLILFFLIFWSGGVLSKVFDPALRFWFNLLH